MLLDTERHVPVHAEGLVTSLVLAEHGESVHTVIVDGEVMVSAGRSTRVDDAAMAERSRALQRRIHENLPERQAFYDRYVDVLTEVHDHAMAQPRAGGAPGRHHARIRRRRQPAGLRGTSR